MGNLLINSRLSIVAVIFLLLVSVNVDGQKDTDTCEYGFTKMEFEWEPTTKIDSIFNTQKQLKLSIVLIEGDEDFNITAKEILGESDSVLINPDSIGLVKNFELAFIGAQNDLLQYTYGSDAIIVTYGKYKILSFRFNQKNIRGYSIGMCSLSTTLIEILKEHFIQNVAVENLIKHIKSQ